MHFKGLGAHPPISENGQVSLTSATLLVVLYNVHCVLCHVSQGALGSQSNLALHTTQLTIGDRGNLPKGG